MATTRTPTDKAFQTWKRKVNELCAAKFGLTLDDLPDMMTRDAFDSGTTPQDFFDDAVMRVMREDFGSVIDEI